MIRQRDTVIRIAIHPDIFVAEVLQSSASPYSLFSACNSGLFGMVQHFERSAKRKNDNLFCSMNNFEKRWKKLFQAIEGQVLQPVSCQGVYFLHILFAKSAEGKDTTVRQEAMATGEEPLRVGKPLQGGTGSYQVRFLWKLKGFRITRHEFDSSFVVPIADVLYTFFHFGA